jgi:hypothetical protein
MSYRAKSSTPIIIVDLQNFFNCLVVSASHLGPADKPKADNQGMEFVVATESDLITVGDNSKNGNSCKKLRPDDSNDDPEDKGKDKGKQQSGRYVNVNAIMKALTPKEQQRHLDEQVC